MHAGVAANKLLHLRVDAKRGADLLLVQVRLNVVEDRVAHAALWAVVADVVDVLAALLEAAENLRVAVQLGWDAGKARAGRVAGLDQASAGRVGVVHGLAFALRQNRAVRAVARHLRVVLVLHQRINQAVANADAAQAQRALLVRCHRRGEQCRRLRA
ncbi:hypothetical protein GQ42DRAFT_14719 [Ramicandelaber brevisporus]|nr:hypothetical protein GQ42DRAFT_14719 [Ramicandelaber brevisporus]